MYVVSVFCCAANLTDIRTYSTRNLNCSSLGGNPTSHKRGETTFSREPPPIFSLAFRIYNINGSRGPPVKGRC